MALADAVVSAVVEQIVSLSAKQAAHRINLVRGAEKEVHSLAHELEMVRNVLVDAERRGYKERSVKAWLSRLEHMSYEMEDVLDEWNYAILKFQIEGDRSDDDASKRKKVRSFITSCFHFKRDVVRYGIAKKIVDVKIKLDEVLREKDRYGFVISRPIVEPSWRVPSTSFVDLEKVCGREADRDILVEKLMDRQEEVGVQVVSIVGVGGLGKTTLAQLIYNDSRVVSFFELMVWVCVSDPFDLVAIAKYILEGVRRGTSSIPTQLDALLKDIKESIAGKKFLLVLDDVWTEDSRRWEPLKSCLGCGGKGSKVLVTTRNEGVAKAMGTIENDIHRLQLLSPDDCWSRIALSGRSEDECRNFQDIGKEIASKCDGLPLAASVLGSLLRFKNSLEEWERVLESEIWELEEAEEQLFPHLLLSYNELSPELKLCFSYCAVFPKDLEIDVDHLIESWIAQGYLGSGEDMELKGRECFQNLAMRSLFQDFVRDSDGKITCCKMHDIVHDFAQSLRIDRSSVTVEAGTKKSTCHRCSSSLVSSVKTYRTLLSFDQTYICDCLTSLRVLGVHGDSLDGIPSQMLHLIHLRWLDLGFNPISSDFKIICRLYNLQFLRLKVCQIEEVPSEIGNLIQLRLLDLGSNDPLKELPKEIGNLTQLKHLDLSYNSLEELPKEIGNLIQLKHLDLSSNSLEELPKEIGNLIQLKYLDLSSNSLEELPKEIGNLIRLKHLDLSSNDSLTELPEEIGNLVQLKYFDLKGTESLEELPESICGLINLEHIFINGATPKPFPQGVSKLTRLRTLDKFWGGRGWGRLGWLKNLNHLSGSLELKIKLIHDSKDMIEDAREANLSNKMHLREVLKISFDEAYDVMYEENDWMNVMDALEPHPNLQNLEIQLYKGSKLSGWITSPLLQLRSIQLWYFDRMQSLPPFGKLPCLEQIEFWDFKGLQLVGREFLGMTAAGASSSNTTTVGFPKLKRLGFYSCMKWKEWEDITAEEEVSASVTFMPCLTELEIFNCDCLTALPERLLGKKASSLEYVQLAAEDLSASLITRYQDREGATWFFDGRLSLQVPFKPKLGES